MWVMDRSDHLDPAASNSSISTARTLTRSARKWKSVSRKQMTQRNVPPNRPALLPGSVPLQVSVSAAFGRVDRTELSTAGIVRIDFVCFFGGRSWAPDHHSGTAVEVVSPPSGFRENPDGVTWKYHQVRVAFEYVQACRI